MTQRVTSSKMSRYGIMATQLLATMTTIHHPLKGRIVVYLVNPHHLSSFIVVARCVARILDTDVGKTLMIVEMLKFLRARTMR